MDIFPSIIITQQNEDSMESSFCSFFKKFSENNFSSSENTFISTIRCSNKGVNKANGEELIILGGSSDKKEIYKTFVENDYVLNEYLWSIILGEAGWFSLGSTMEANINGIFPKSPNICLVFDAASPVYSSLFKVLIRQNDFNPSTPNNCPYITLLLDYDSRNKSKEYKSSVLANLKELDHFIAGESDANPNNISIYIVDDETEQGRSIGSIENKYLAFSKLIETLFRSRNLLRARNWGDNEGKKCCVSTFGLSSIYFPEYRILEYLKAYSEYKELDELIKKDFSIKHDRLRLNQEIENFFRKENYDGITEKLLVKEGEKIWKEFNVPTDGLFSVEKTECCEYETNIIDKQDTRSMIFTNKILGDINTRYEQFKIDQLSRVYSDIQLVKVSIEQEIIDRITDQNTSDINALREHKGINYAKIFNAILCGSSAKYAEAMDGQTIEFRNLKHYEDGMRKKLVGNRLIELEKEIQEIQDEIANLNLLTAGNKDIEADEFYISELKEKESKIKACITSINEAFDANVFKDDLKQEFNPPIDEKLNEMEGKIKKLDIELSEQYVNKNNLIKKRSKFLILNLVVYPSLILVISCLLQLILFFNFEFFRLDFIKAFSGLTIILLLVYYIVNFIRFLKMKKELSGINNFIEDKLSNKHSLIQQLIKLKSFFDYNNFLFDVGLRALNILKSVENHLNSRCDEMDKFTAVVRSQYDNSMERINSLDFTDNEFEAITVKKEQISKIYDSTYPDYALASDDSVKYASFLNDFINSGSIDTMLNRLEELSKDVYERRIAPIDVNNVIQNKSTDFETKVPLDTRLEILKNNSMPLLRTSIVTPEMPITKNYLIGNVFNAIKDVLQKRFTSFREGESLEKDNIKKIGVLAIKSNFSFAMIENMPSWYEEIEQSKEYANQTFIDEEARSWNLLGSNEAEQHDERTLDELLIVMLSQKIIDFKYNKFKSSLSDAVVAENWKDLKIWWNSKRSKDEKDRAIRFQNDIDKLSDELMNDFLKSLKTLIKEEYFNQSERSIIENYLTGMSSSM